MNSKAPSGDKQCHADNGTRQIEEVPGAVWFAESHRRERTACVAHVHQHDDH